MERKNDQSAENEEKIKKIKAFLTTTSLNSRS